MNIDGYYYLHVNGSLIYKRGSESVVDLRDSDLVQGFWPFSSDDRESVWRICVEGLATGAKPERIRELADLWQCDDDDARNYAERLGVELYMDGNKWCAIGPGHINLQESPTGFGDTCLEAMADLAKAYGYKPSKMWGHTLQSLMQSRDPASGQFGVGA